MIAANTRVLSGPATGTHRYLRNLLPHMPGVQQLAPPRPLHGLRGHLWEQARLPGLARGALLWSPSNTGPLRVARQVVTVHDVAFLDVPAAQTATFRNWYAQVVPRVARKAQAVLTVSSFSRDRIADRFGVPPERIHVVPNGVDHAVFRPGPPSDALTVVAVGTLEPRKNLGGLLRAWRHVVAARPEARLVVAGGAGKSTIFEQEELPDVPGCTFAGRIPDEELARLYQGAAAVACPSLYEGFGLPCLEAMACGAPVLYNDIPPFRELAGPAGLATDATDPRRLADAILRLLGDASLRAELARKGHARSLAYTWEAAAAATHAVLRRCEEDA